MRRRYYNPRVERLPLEVNTGGMSAPQPNALNSPGQATFDTDPNTANLVTPAPFEYVGEANLLPVLGGAPVLFTLIDDGSSSALGTTRIKTLPCPANMVGIIDGIYPYLIMSGMMNQSFLSGLQYTIPLGPSASYFTITVNGRPADGYGSFSWLRSPYAQQPSSRPLLYLRPGEAFGATFRYVDISSNLYGGVAGIRITGAFIPTNTVGGSGWEYKSQPGTPRTF